MRMPDIRPVQETVALLLPPLQAGGLWTEGRVQHDQSVWIYGRYDMILIIIMRIIVDVPVNYDTISKLR